MTQREFESRWLDVSCGYGGFSYLIVGNEKTALFETGMAYGGEGLVKRLRQALGGRKLDYILLSHSHYDHAGGLTAVRHAFPGAVPVGSAYGAKVLRKESVRDFFASMSRTAQRQLLGKYQPFPFWPELLDIGLTVGDGDTLSLGGLTVEVVETPGHTHCSLSYFLREPGVLLASESLGIHLGDEVMPVCLTSGREMVRSVEKCRVLPVKGIYHPHQQVVWGEACEAFFELARRAPRKWREMLQPLEARGMELEQMVQWLWEHYGPRCKGQPKEAFFINARHIIPTLLEDR
ncbi:MAG: MBL fold metallo-hydrolase [Eubacteriales bacterium]|jgi:glyoxylase-like metal-dependent hydrolase (beta-lactamase superfamily II)